MRNIVREREGERDFTWTKFELYPSSYTNSLFHYTSIVYLLHIQKSHAATCLDINFF